MNQMEHSIQINDGFTQTSADGGCLCFDPKYGIMFCAYMPGQQGNYGESRSKISLSYFPASQPTNIRFVDISEGNDEYLPNILGFGDGRVRVFYEKFSRREGDHPLCYKDFNYLDSTLSEEKQVMVQKENGEIVPYSLSVVFEYLEAKGYYNHICCNTEQIGCCTPFRHGDYVYGGAVSFLSEVALFRSMDDMATLEFFAVFPKQAQYEFDYRILNGKLHAIYRTEQEQNSIFYTESPDMGMTWTEPKALENSIQCRPRMICYRDQILMAYNYYDPDTGNRPEIQQGRTAVKLILMHPEHSDEVRVLADLHSKYGIVNVCIVDLLGDLYMAFSTSELALEYQNGNPKVRGKDAIRYLKLGDLTE
ncbi:MAG: exo-alpha-sialidase [Ruminococcaceae bacterium]|nr:exo-alpha-sialidase [Oscillospiraceae bacterium]